MAQVRRRRTVSARRLAALGAAAGLILLAGVAHAQMGAGRFRADVETLDAQGQVIGQAQGEALGSVLSRDRLYFEVPIQTTGASYRVRVLSWDTFATGQ